jgi:Holliday junction DNA helicase RuvA
VIARLHGEVADVEPGRLVVDVHGVGYEVWAPESVLADHPIGTQATLTIRMLVREDDISLYGFANPAQRHLFDLLRGVQGCGAKTSLALIGTLGEALVRDSILAHDNRTLIKAPGVGPKLAEKIVASLRDRMAEVVVSGGSGGSVTRGSTRQQSEDELTEALIALGYPRARIEPFLQEARDEASDVQSQIRIVLKRLAR